MSADPAGSSGRRIRRSEARRSRATRKRGVLYSVIEIVGIVGAAFAVAILVQAFLFKPFTVHQISMLPTLEEGDRILLNRLTYSFRDPRAGDVVVFRPPVVGGEEMVKRVVAVAGDTVAIRHGDLYVNGARVDEPYLLEQEFSGEFPELAIPPGKVFTLGDNRNNSGDSRLFGLVDEEAIIGCAFVVYWPPSHWAGL